MIYGFGKGITGYDLEYRVLGKFVPITKISDIKEGDKLLVCRSSIETSRNGRKYLADSELTIKDDIRGYHEEEV